VHPTSGSLRVFEHFVWLGVGSGKLALSPLAQPPVTQAVGQFLAKRERKEWQTQMFIDSKKNKWQIVEREDGSVFVYFEKINGNRVVVYDNVNLMQRLHLTDSNIRLRWLGVLLTVLGVLGYITVADDLRHVGEFLGVTMVLGAGLILLFASWLRSRG
jgi:hypothetical protein